MGPATRPERAESLYTNTMSRTPIALLLLAFAAAPLRADDASKGPAAVDPAALQAQNDQLRDAVASPSVDNASVQSQAANSFDGAGGILRNTPDFRAAPRLMDREPVDGHVGTIKGMVDEAQKRYDRFKLSNVPDPKLDAAIAYARELFGKERVKFDSSLPEIQMGEFEYSLTDKSDLGSIKLNARLALLATRIGEAFCYAPLVHEAAHAKARAEGRLDPAHTLDNEVEAYRVQYLWLKALDPRAERMIVLMSTLKLHLQVHPEDSVSRLSVAYLQHLLDLWDTGGEDAKIRDFVTHHGYREGGVDPAATAIRA